MRGIGPCFLMAFGVTAFGLAGGTSAGKADGAAAKTPMPNVGASLKQIRVLP